MNKTGPTINRGSSRQDWGTPPDFLAAVERKFGTLDIDLASDDRNYVAPNYLTKEEDSLKSDWHKLKGLMWLNPPFDTIEPWAAKCAGESASGAKVLFLVPASVGSNWYRNYVEPYAFVLGLNPRLKFVGAKDAYPKDLILACYMYGFRGFQTWRWK